MWFKNLQVYRFTKPFTLTTEVLDEQLAKFPFQPCGSQDTSKIGFVSPLGDEAEILTHSAGGYIMLCCKKQQKVLPAAVVNEALEEQVRELEQKDARKVGRKERQQIKDELVMTLLPQAFKRSTRLFAYIAPQDGLLIVNSASTNRAEELLVALREALGSLPVIPATCKNLPQQVMTNWLKHRQSVKGFELGGECELRDPSDEGGIIRCKNQDLSAKHIVNHLDDGMYVSKLALIAESGIECVVDEKLAIKRVVYGDMIQEKADQVDAETAAEQFDVDFSIMTLELSAFLKQLFALFGGEDLTACDDEKDEQKSVEAREPLEPA